MICGLISPALIAVKMDNILLEVIIIFFVMSLFILIKVYNFILTQLCFCPLY